jgi:hypothetical protein
VRSAGFKSYFGDGSVSLPPQAAVSGSSDAGLDINVYFDWLNKYQMVVLKGIFSHDQNWCGAGRRNLIHI